MIVNQKTPIAVERIEAAGRRSAIPSSYRVSWEMVADHLDFFVHTASSESQNETLPGAECPDGFLEWSCGRSARKKKPAPCVGRE